MEIESPPPGMAQVLEPAKAVPGFWKNLASGLPPPGSAESQASYKKRAGLADAVPTPGPAASRAPPRTKIKSLNFIDASRLPSL